MDGSRGKVQQPYHKNIPYIGHKRLVIVQPSAHGWRVKQSSLLGEIDRIYHKVRPSLAYQPTEDYLNSRSILSFDDETRSIRAKTAEILKRIHTPVPRAQRPLPLPGDLYYSHTELPITERITSNNYIDRLLSSFGSQPVTVHVYTEPKPYTKLGKGHLACLTYAGGRPISRRKNLASTENYIRDDINVLSHYNRFRQAAEKATHSQDAEFGSVSHPPPSMSPVTGSWKSNAPRRTQSDKVFSKAGAEDSDGMQKRKKTRREILEEEALKEAQEEKRRNQELKCQEELSDQAAADRQAELDRKAKQEEEERLLREENEKLEAMKKAQEEEERKAKEEEEAKLAEQEKQRKAKEAEEKRKAEEERKAKEEEERKAKEEEERKAKEEEERKAKEEEERKAREEEERKAKEEEERKAREEEERKAKEEEERLAKEEAERKAEEERLALEEEERRLREEEEKMKQEAEVAAAAEKEEELVEESENKELENPEESVMTSAKDENTEEPQEEPVVEEPTSPNETSEKPFTDAEEEKEEELEEEVEEAEE